MATLTERIAALSPTKHALLIERLQVLSTQQAANLSIPLMDRTQDLPLSFSQQRLWFISQFEGTQAAYNIPLCLQLTGDLDEAALVKSFEAILARHEVLRTRFVLKQGEPVQVIDEQPELPWQRLDWQSVEEAAIASQLDTFLASEYQRCFDMQSGPLFQLTLIQSAPDRQYLIANFHHIITDGWSMGVLIQELTALYQQFIQSSAAPTTPLPALPIQYADYAAWQRQWLTGNVLAT
ncbi:MAG: condensation domain-containing protein, partial [Cyanobacteria bacterium J06553_1]